MFLKQMAFASAYARSACFLHTQRGGGDRDLSGQPSDRGERGKGRMVVIKVTQVTMSIRPDKTVMCTYIYIYIFELIKVHLCNQHRRRRGGQNSPRDESRRRDRGKKTISNSENERGGLDSASFKFRETRPSFESCLTN